MDGRWALHPLRRIKATPVGFESLGVRSMCMYVETPDVRVLIDPGVSLGPRFRLLPHPLEYRALRSCRARIKRFAAKAEVATASHYHFDHISPALDSDAVWTWSDRATASEIYGGKRLLVKDVREKINYSQRKRGWIFQKIIRDAAKSVEACDGRTYEFGGTTLRFSQPVVHGEDEGGLGWVVMLTITCADEKLMHCPDVQGPSSKDVLDLILTENPQMAIVGGPPSYLAGFKTSRERISQAVENLATLARHLPVTVLDHHLLRDERWREVSDPAFKAAAESGCRVLTAAESAGLPNKLLESQRKRLYEEHPPSEEFTKWTKLSREEQRRTKPPI
ncbi:MAG: hypothetical protein QW057_07510 [Candidatus Bathyarchaeia archaeon]